MNVFMALILAASPGAWDCIGLTETEIQNLPKIDDMHSIKYDHFMPEPVKKPPKYPPPGVSE